jgi:MFS family permease
MIAAEQPGIYRRDALTQTSFAGLFAFGLLNATLGPALPYLRSIEGTTYLAGALHQAAFSLGGGLAGVLAARARHPYSRVLTIRAGLATAGLAGVGLAFGNRLPVTVAAAFVLGLLATSALIAIWAQLAEHHGEQRAVAMAEGEVAVSLAGILMPALVGLLASSDLTWRGGLVVGAVVAAVSATIVRLEAPQPAPRPPRRRRVRRPPPTLVVVLAIVGLEFTLSFWLASYLVDDVAVARNEAAAVVAGLYAANLVGRLLASRLARRHDPQRLLIAALMAALAGLPLLLTAHTLAPALAGITLSGAGIGATFPLCASLHIKASGYGADAALGEILTTASVGQILGPLCAGAIAQGAGLRVGLLVLPVLITIAGAALARTTVD